MIMLALPIVLTSCGYGGIGAIESPAWHATASVADKKRYYTDQCLAFGFEENTTEMAKCIQTQSNTSRSRSKSTLNSAFDDYNRRRSEAYQRSVDRLLAPDTVRCRTSGRYTRCNAY